jgi:hypothetical protein
VWKVQGQSRHSYLPLSMSMVHRVGETGTECLCSPSVTRVEAFLSCLGSLFMSCVLGTSIPPSWSPPKIILYNSSFEVPSISSFPVPPSLQRPGSGPGWLMDAMKTTAQLDKLTSFHGCWRFRYLSGRLG